MRKYSLLLIIVTITVSANAQIKEFESWFNQAIKDVQQSGKDVESAYNLVNKQVETKTLQFVNEVNQFSNQLLSAANTLGDDCNRYSEDIYLKVKPAIDNQTTQVVNIPGGPGKDICQRCIKDAVLQMICRIPETVQGNMAFMDKMYSAMNDERVKNMNQIIKPIGAITVTTIDDFINEFNYYFTLTNDLGTSIDASKLSISEQQLMEYMFSKENCEAIADMAFDSMLGAMKDKSKKLKAKKRYAALLKLLKGYENLEKVSGWNDQLNNISSFFPESKASSISIPSENPLLQTGGLENVYINATGNKLWVDARNWSKKRVPLPFEVAYIPFGKQVSIDRSVSIRTLIDENPNGSGVTGKNFLSIKGANDCYDGFTFTIQAKNSGHYFGINADSKVKGGNVIQWNNPTHGSHHFRLKSTGDGDGSYYIVSKWSGLYLDVFGPSKANGANLGQWTFSGWDNQKFYLDEAGGGYYFIRSKHSNKVLDISGCANSVGTNVQQWERVEGATCQMFRLQPVTLSGRVFMLESKMSPNKVLDKQGNSSTVYIFDKHKGPNQQFLFQWAGTDDNGQEWYFIINRENWGYLVNQNYGVHNGTNIITLTDHKFGNDWATMYGLIPYDQNYFYIKSRFTKDVGGGKWDGGRYFDISGCRADNGTILQLYDQVAGANCQLFKLVEIN